MDTTLYKFRQALISELFHILLGAGNVKDLASFNNTNLIARSAGGTHFLHSFFADIQNSCCKEKCNIRVANSKISFQ